MPCRRSNALRRDSGDCPWIALRRSPVPEWNQKDAEGVKPERVNLSGKRTEKKVLDDFFVRSFCVAKTPFLLYLAQSRR